MDEDLVFLPIAELAALYRRRAISPVDVTTLLLDRIAKLDPHLHAYITVAADQAVADARAAERRLVDGDESPLVGIPMAVKDSLATRGIRTTANSRVLEHWIPHRDATAVTRLRSAGAVIIGKTNLNEFGWSIPSPEDFYPPPRNPWNPQYVAIGSSSGSGVAVAAGLAIAALGTDGGGSVRLPAGQMGLVGIKATHALISRSGSLHVGTVSDVGPMVRTVTDAALVLEAVAAWDPEDPEARPSAQVDYRQALEAELRGYRVGIPESYIASIPVEPEVGRAFDQAVTDLARLGVPVAAVDLSALEFARAANFVALNAEHYAAHEAVLRTHWARHGRSARLYLAQAAFLTAADYLRARQVGRVTGAMIDAVLRDVDALVMPTSPVVTAEAARRPEAHRRGVNASFTAPFNLTGHPALSVPCGISATGLPMGLQIVGRRYDEGRLLRLAHAYEQATPWHTLRPRHAAPRGAGP
ncbi:MAG: amidase [Armatimonadota bacterium]|nr:amidase [Armatimonadota bacterium]